LTLNRGVTIFFFFDVLRQTFELIDEQQRVQRGDLEPLAAGLAHDFVVDANEMVPQLRELGSVALIRARREPILLDAPNPADRVLVGPIAART
jgi:hypothetical protein